MHKVLFVGLSPGFQKTMLFEKFEVNEVSRCKKYWFDVSGKCINSARVFSQLGGNSLCLTQVGGCSTEKFISLAQKSVNLCPVLTEVEPRICYTIINESDGTISELVVNEPEAVLGEVEHNFIEKFNELVPNYSAVVISGSRLSGFSDKIIPRIVEKSKKLNKLVFADYRNEDLKNSFINERIRPDFIKINMQEFYDTFHNKKNDFNFENELKELTLVYNNVFIITQGAKETVYCDRGNIGSFLPEKIKALNPIGCGDSFTSGLVMGVLDGKNLLDALKQGNETAKMNALNIRPGFIK
ncbi:MAG TPA: PfkB family carbohydrate kinase [Victivallales bacterium]|nr:PfkB family carbohydrate kinase [Victivallales bacterium]